MILRESELNRGSDRKRFTARDREKTSQADREIEWKRDRVRVKESERERERERLRDRYVQRDGERVCGGEGD